MTVLARCYFPSVRMVSLVVAGHHAASPSGVRFLKRNFVDARWVRDHQRTLVVVHRAKFGFLRLNTQVGQ